jgi:alpha-L-arabinofuranosidase
VTTGLGGVVAAMKDLLLDGEYQVVVLVGDSRNGINDIEHPDRVVTENKKLIFTKGVVIFPPHSLSIVRVYPN